MNSSYKNKMCTIFMNFQNSQISDPYRVLHNLTDKINLKRSEKYAALSNLSIYYTWKNIKSSYRTINVKYVGQRGMLYESWIMLYIRYLKLFKIKLSKKVTFRIKTGYFLQLLTKLTGNTKSEINKDENSKNVPRLANYLHSIDRL